MEINEAPVARRVAFYIYSLDQGGAERVTSILANRYADMGIEVAVFVMKSVSSNSYSLRENIRIINLSEEKALKAAGSGLLYNIKRICILRRSVKSYSPQVLFTMMINANVIGALALLRSGIACVVSERNDPSQFPVGTLWAVLRRISYGLSFSVVAQTSRAQKWLEKNTSAKRVTVIPNPIELPMIDGQPHVETPNKDEKMILAVGRLCQQKQFDHLIDAFSSLTRDFPGWSVSILGEGGDREDLLSQISSRRVEGKVRLIGRVGNMSDWYQAADLFVMPSRFEGFPNALAEAMANGVPSISYDCPSGPAELIDQGINGWLAKANSVDDLTSKMRAVMDNPHIAEGVSIEARKISKSLNPVVIANRWLSVAGLKPP